MKLIWLIVVAALILAVSVFAMTGCNQEYLPSEKLLHPVLSLKLNLIEQSKYEESIEFLYSGRYISKLILRHTELNKPPRNDLDKRQFLLKGQIRLADSEELIYMENFEVTIEEYNAGMDLLQFEIQDKGKKLFYIEFEDIDPRFEEYFSDTELYVQRQLKHSIFD